MMKKILLSVSAGVMALSVMAQGGKFTLTGKMTGLNGFAVYSLINSHGEVLTQNMELVADEKVDFSFDMDSIGWLIVMNNNRMFMLPAVPGETVTISGGMDDYTVDGSPLYREYNEVLTATRPLIEAIGKYDFKQECQSEIAGKSSEEVFDLYQSKLRENDKPLADAVLSFVRDHADRESSMMVLNYLNYAEDLETAVRSISEKVFEGRMRPFYESVLDRIMRRGASCHLLNKMAPDFNLKDIDGNSLSLSSLRGNWVILHFWSSTCRNAISQFPALKDCYDNYRDRIVFLGMDIQDSEAHWKSAVNTRHKLPWLNVLADTDVEDPQNPVNLYEETATPAYFLIAPSGKVAMKGGSVDEFRDIFKILFE